MNEQEQEAYDYLVQAHAMFKTELGLSDAEILKVAKTNGQVPWKAMTKYCDDHNSPHPQWPKGVRF